MTGCYGQSGSGYTSESRHHKDHMTYSHGLSEMNSNRGIYHLEAINPGSMLPIIPNKSNLTSKKGKNNDIISEQHSK